MTTTLRDALAEQIDQIAPAQLSTNELVGLGERRMRRHRLTVALGSAAAVALVTVLAVGGTALHRSADPGPTNIPNTDRHQRDDQTTPPYGPEVKARQVVYSESQLFAHKTGSIHFGDRSVETGDGFVHIDVTDDGFIYTSDGRAWFSDGGTPVQIGSHVCGASTSGEFSSFAHRSVMSANTGSLAAWFECTEAARPTLVVYDPASGTEIDRRPVDFCQRSCELVDVTADHVYFNAGVYAGFPKPEYEFGVTTHQLRASSRQSYAEDLTSHSRGLVIGDTRRTGTATNGIGQGFSVVGSRLVSMRPESGELTNAFDTSSRHAVRLRLPLGYHRYPNETFVLFEWLDDNTVALAGTGSGDGFGDIVTCQLSSGRCDVTVKRAEGNGAGYRILPYLPLPG